MKLVINKCFGGFSLSNEGLARFYQLHGRQTYFFKQNHAKGDYAPLEPGERAGLLSYAFDVPNPNDFKQKELWAEHYLTNRPEDRSDPFLIQTIEEMGKKADGLCAELRIIEIPDNISWELDEYDGIESIHETHRSW